MRWIFFFSMALLWSLAAFAQGAAMSPPQTAYRPESQTRFESRLADRLSGHGARQTDLVRDPAPNNARGLALKGKDAAIIGLTVTGRKYGVSLDNTGEVLIKNFVFRRRQSEDCLRLRPHPRPVGANARRDRFKFIGHSLRKAGFTATGTALTRKIRSKLANKPAMFAQVGGR